MSKTRVLFILVIIVLCANFVFAQYNDATVPGPQTDAKNVIREEVKPDKISQTAPQERIEQTDEYGSFNFNAFLGPLGANGGYVAVPGTWNENVDGSLEAWIYPTATTSSAPAVVAKGDATNVGIFWYWSASSSVMGIRFGNTATTNTGGTTVPLNQWTHVAVTWSGGAGNYTVTFYVNGTQSGSTATNTGSWNVTSDSLTIGSSRASFGGKNFYGYIDEVRYWSGVRTATEIRNNRFVGIGDASGANTGGALTASTSYAGCNNSWPFNTGSVAYDDIGGNNGYFRNGANTVYATYASQPIPYNLALYCPFDAGSYVQVPGNSIFSGQSTDGSIDAWVHPTGQSTTHMVVSRGTAGFDFFWGIRASISNRQVLCLNSTQFQNSDGIVIPLNKWSHIAVKWVISGGSATVTFYVNGVQSGAPVTSAATWNSNVGTVRIGGWHGGSANNFNGYIDEVRFWEPALTLAQVRRNMFVTCRNMAGTPTPLASYNFDGNLINFTTTTGINGTFSNGGTNNCRFSGFKNETSSGAPANTFIAHPTVINRGSTNPFSLGYNMRYANKTIPDNATIYDTLHFVTPRAITSVEVFIAIQHTWVGDLTLILRAPNNTTRTIIANTGGTGEGILTFFHDGSPVPTTAGFFAPWSNLAGPPSAFGTFGGANMLGNWILSVNDNASPDPGLLMAWGLRFNGDVTTGVEPVTGNIPEKFELLQNYPNPFNPVTTIKFDIPVASIVKLSVFDMLGREVKVLLNENKTAGSYSVDFEAAELSSGTYFYKISAGKYSDIKKMVVLK